VQASPFRFACAHAAGFLLDALSVITGSGLAIHEAEVMSEDQSARSFQFRVSDGPNKLVRQCPGRSVLPAQSTSRTQPVRTAGKLSEAAKCVRAKVLSVCSAGLQSHLRSGLHPWLGVWPWKFVNNAAQQGHDSAKLSCDAQCTACNPMYLYDSAHVGSSTHMAMYVGGWHKAMEDAAGAA
jgi:hypothetical protein